jgi:hypothetical protein
MKANLLTRVLAAKATVFVALAMMVAVVLGAASTVQAAPGDQFILGRLNQAFQAISRLVGDPAGPVLRIDNNSTATGATALDLQVESGKTPMMVNSETRVTNLNADRLDDREASSFANAIHAHSGADITSGTVAEARIDAAVARDSEVIPKVLASDGTNSGLDADKLDGKDSTRFLSAVPYEVDKQVVVPLNASNHSIEVSCDPGDVALSGGADDIEPPTQLNEVSRLITSTRTWEIEVSRPGRPPDTDTVIAEVYCWDLPPLR